MLMVNWDGILVTVSLIVAFIASFTALDIAGRMAAARGRRALLWLPGGGAAMGIGIWAMHFIGMLAMMMPLATRYDIPLTLGSLLLAMAGSAAALWFAASRAVLTLRRWLAGTLTLGGSIIGMHYIGMRALLISPAIRWDGLLVAVSCVVAIGASGLALWLAFHLRRNLRGVLLLRLGAALVMGIAVAGMHYIGMAAAHFSTHSMIDHQGFSAQGLAVWVTIITLSILGLTLLASMLDAQLQAAKLAYRLTRANRELKQLAMRDGLTGLPNRIMLEQQLDRSLRRASREDHPLALMFMDLDGFKAVNDAWGHHIGDRLLRAVAERLNDNLPETAMLARLGGDEFVVMLNEANRAQAGQVAGTLVKAIDAPFDLARYQLRVSLSVGIALFPEHGRTRKILMLNADAAMYHTKQSGRNGWHFFEPAMHTLTQHQLQLATDLWAALDRQELRLFYQPQFSTGNQQPLGFEALLRWQHPTRGLLTPEKFLARAEKTGLIVSIGNWVINEACRQLRQWHTGGHPEWSVAVNLSALQFQQHDLLNTVRDALARYQLPAGSLTLEIAESVTMRDPAFSQQIIAALASLGVRIAIDNFGIGYANLLQLKHLAASELKIDRNFINSLRADSEDATVVRAMLTMAHGLNLDMVAEGVETAEQQLLLTRLGFTTLQGYLLGKPLPAERVAQAIASPP